MLKCSSAKVKRILHKGDSFFWTVSENYVTFIGVRKILAKINDPFPTKITCIKDCDLFNDSCGSLKFGSAVRARAEMFKSSHGKTTSRNSLTIAAGISKPTQVKYEKISGVKVTPRYLVKTILDPKIQVGKDTLVAPGCRLVSINKQTHVVQQLPNKFSTPQNRQRSKEWKVSSELQRSRLREFLRGNSDLKPSLLRRPIKYNGKLVYFPVNLVDNSIYDRRKL